MITTAPGEEGQVDYGDGPMVRHPQTRQVPAHAALRPDARLLAQSGAAAGVAVEHAGLGRAPRARVSSARRHGARHRPRQSQRRRPHARTSTTPRSIRSTATCSRTTASSRCRVASAIPIARAKSKPASGTRRRRRCAGCASRSLDEAQAYLDRWEAHWADTRIHGTTKRQVAAMFAEEQPALGPLPLEPFRYYRFGVRTVHLDGCVEVEAAYYGAPPGWIGRRVDVQWNDLFVRLLDPKTGQLLREHVRAPRGWHRIADADRPRRTPPKTVALLEAAHARRAVGQHHLRSHPPARGRSRRPSHPRRARRWPRNTAPPSSKTPPRPPSSSACRRIASSAAISNAGHRCR